MEFIKNDFIRDNNNRFINFGYINNILAIIFSDFQILTVKNILDESTLVNHNGNSWTLVHKTKPINLIYPCNKDFSDSSTTKYIIITESAIDYNTKILPYINNIYTENTRWINDILRNKKEQNKIMFKNEKYIVTKDILWDEENIPNSFYMLAIPFSKIKTIRDLRKEDIPILKEMKNSCNQIAKKYGINDNQLYFFFHYHPSFYHLHLHCSIINHKLLSSKYLRCKMLDSVISNLEKNSFYYKNSDISFEIPVSHIIVKLLSTS